MIIGKVSGSNPGGTTFKFSRKSLVVSSKSANEIDERNKFLKY